MYIDELYASVIMHIEGFSLHDFLLGFSLPTGKDLYTPHCASCPILPLGEK